MAASIFDSPMFVTAFPTGEASRLFSDSAAVRAVLLVEGSLAKVQGELGLIPEDSAFFIHRSAMEVQIDPAGLAAGLHSDGFVPAVVAAFAKAMEAPEHSKFIHHNIEAAEIEAAALALRMRQFLSYCEKQIENLGNPDVEKAAINAALARARGAAVGLHLSAGLEACKALSDALRLPLRDHPVAVSEVAAAAQVICSKLAEAKPDHVELSKLSQFCDGMTKTLAQDAANMLTLCLPQACLCAAAALEIENN